MEIAALLFPDLTQLDLAGPYEVLARIPSARIHLVAASREPVRAEGGLTIVPSATFDDIRTADVLFVPGGTGQIAATADERTRAWVRDLPARWITSACTGALLLGAAGRLRGYRAATHWAFMDLLPLVGAMPTDQRVVIDRDRITGGGVTAGIDIALAIAEAVAGAEIAARIALQLEYDPSPAHAGHPRTAPLDRVAAMRTKLAPRHTERRRQLEQLAQLSASTLR
jgi:cyclohexyl-isocyanide hydratase